MHAVQDNGCIRQTKPHQGGRPGRNITTRTMLTEATKTNFQSAIKPHKV